MKNRIRLLCLALALCLCLAACAPQTAEPTTLGTVESTTTTIATTAATTTADIRATKNIILIIGDGMGLEHIRGGQLYDGKEYGFSNWQTVSIDTAPITYSGQLSTEATYSAASATAMATGHLTVN